MDRRERLNDELISDQMRIDSSLARVWTALPGIVQSYDKTRRTCTAQAAVQAQWRDPTGTWQNVSLPVMTDVPVMFPGGGEYEFYFPVSANDEGLLVFSSRCIDAWWQSGGVQPQAEIRSHDLSDAFFVPGAYSQPNVPSEPANDTIQMRSKNGSSYVELDANSGRVNIVAFGGLWVNGVRVVVP